jgi:mannan endo-1,4-beta-mannosidase
VIERLLRFAAACLTVGVLGQPAFAQNHRYEAESGFRFQTTIGNSGSASGGQYVTGFDSQQNQDYVQLQVDVPDGLYEMWVGYRSVFGQKGYHYQVDGESGSGMFDMSSTFTADRAGVFNVSAGLNTLKIQENWGFYDIDYLEFRPYVPPTILPVLPQLSDPQASPATQQLMNYLTGIYGTKTLAGQQGPDREQFAFPSQGYLTASGGLVPAVRGSDLMAYSPSRHNPPQWDENPNNESELMIDWARKTGGIVTLSWHWNAPTGLINQPPDKLWWSGFYTNATTFNVQTAMANPGSSDYNLLLRDIDAIAVQLQKFEDAGVPVIWRPLHEAQGGWFWWGAKGAAPFKQLWRLMHDRLTNHHGLHNLIWEFTSSAAEGNHLDWYPGDDVVDMVGLDIYTAKGASMSGQWNDILGHYNGRKMIALSETGTLPEPELLDLWGIKWSYFSPWSINSADLGILNHYTPAEIQELLGDDDVVTLDELPVLPWKLGGTLASDFDASGAADGGDLLAWQRHFGGGVTAADGNADRVTNWADLALWKRQFGQTLSPPSHGVPEPDAAAAFGVAAISVGVALRRRRAAC